MMEQFPTSQFNLPVHVAIIMDGNGRWAKAQGKERIFGHQKGVETVRNIVELSTKAGIKYLSLFAFSTENWNRPQNEVNALMELLVLAIERELPDLQKNNIKLKTLGDIDRLPENCRMSIDESIRKTAENTGLTLSIALSYSGKWDILSAAFQLALLYKQNKIGKEDFNELNFSDFLSTANMPEPELLIRTGGETRISNFFLWQSAYTELYFSTKYWPEFDEKEFNAALHYFQTRERRFGKTSEQLT
jgi:undecaprenyl diphosphate synthase